MVLKWFRHILTVMLPRGSIASCWRKPICLSPPRVITMSVIQTFCLRLSAALWSVTSATSTMKLILPTCAVIGSGKKSNHRCTKSTVTAPLMIICSCWPKDVWLIWVTPLVTQVVLWTALLPTRYWRRLISMVKSMPRKTARPKLKCSR